MDEHIGERVYRLRKQKKWSQARLASEASTSASIICKIELGKALRPTYLKSIARALDTTVLYLEYGIDPPEISESKICIAVYDLLNPKAKAIVRQHILESFEG